MRTDLVLVALLASSSLACLGQRSPGLAPDGGVPDGGATIRPLTQSLAVQAAFNDTTFFFHARWTSASVAPSLTVALSGRAPATAVRDFAKAGCFLGCHDACSGMPNWLPEDGARTMYLLPGFGGSAEIWRWRSQPGAPAGQAIHATLGTAGMVVDLDGGAGNLLGVGSLSNQTWDVSYTRDLAAPGAEAFALVPGERYDLGLALHPDGVQGRHHYVSLPIGLDLGEAGVALEAVPLPAGATPDFSDLATFPPVLFDLFLPGVTSFEFLVGAAVGRDGQLRSDDYRHGGALAVAIGAHACGDCHRVVTDSIVPPVQNAGALERLVLRRGGVVGPPRVEVVP